eukprot:525491-Ditylum_brightwellii.AAC.1
MADMFAVPAHAGLYLCHFMSEGNIDMAVGGISVNKVAIVLFGAQSVFFALLEVERQCWERALMRGEVLVLGIVDHIEDLVEKQQVFQAKMSPVSSAARVTVLLTIWKRALAEETLK